MERGRGGREGEETRREERRSGFFGEEERGLVVFFFLGERDGVGREEEGGGLGEGEERRGTGVWGAFGRELFLREGVSVFSF